jgi:ABC-type sugar transport system ATPase subunit
VTGGEIVRDNAFADISSSNAGSQILKMSSISKRYQGVQALDNVELDVRSGEIHALLGGNGAGKSTLLKILSGLILPDEGTISFQGQRVEIESPRRAQELGISMIHQELSIIPDLSVLENIFLGQESLITQRKNWTPWVNRREMAKKVRSVATEFGITEDELWRPAGEFGALKKRSIEIVKALVVQPKILILDEPTSGLEEHEKELLFGHMRSLQRLGVALIWVTHHLDEVFGLADTATIMRDGRSIAQTSIEGLNLNDLISLMFGSQAAALIEQPKIGRTTGKTGSENRFKTLEVVGFKREGVLKDISFELWDGEILGIAGLAGAGRTELMRALMGIDKLDSGSINVFGKIEKIGHPEKAYELGIAMVPEDRKVLGILSEFSIEKSISISKLVNVLKSGWLSAKKEKELASNFISKFSIKTPNSREKIRNLSGGNQQKVIISRCLNSNPRILIFDEPTQGIDIASKVEVHKLIRELAAEGKSVIVIASELNELIRLSDRIIILREGSIVGELESVPEKIQINGYEVVEQDILHKSSRVNV